MLSWLANRMVSHTMARAREGDLGPTLRLDAKNIRFRFPGESRWSGELQGKENLERWLRQIEATGVRLYPDEVVLQGFPWKQTICIRGHDLLESPDGERIYENRFVLWGRIVWGQLREYEAYADTQKLGALEALLDNPASEAAKEKLRRSA
jgi:ketosteroid isomerase-like protein